MNKILVVLIFFATIVTQAQTDKFAAFRSAYETELKDAGIVGSSFVFLKDNKVILEKHYGSANGTGL